MVTKTTACLGEKWPEKEADNADPRGPTQEDPRQPTVSTHRRDFTLLLSSCDQTASENDFKEGLLGVTASEVLIHSPLLC